jgi:hypothetical protein
MIISKSFNLEKQNGGLMWFWVWLSGEKNWESLDLESGYPEKKIGNG